MIEFIRRRNAALWSYRRRRPAVPTGPERPVTRPNQPPAWATAPTVAEPRPGRAGWLTPAQTWRANGGRW
ncbi:hypothetical protein [Micromonospora mirobrigensis]|uniref:Uncharacterized protein n=1 Tax=Micromonospora mirobrigensis TaxID=262898 RepID=A0A1C5ACF8_9ACTN|nr:hypothetical protein [Micromonospora mirobrigensis]SCF42918.1 hypothetical protein GA0070564_10927 [Micromonospora mirobrigensis]